MWKPGHPARVVVMALAMQAAALARPLSPGSGAEPAGQPSPQQPGSTVTVTGCVQRPQSAGSQGGTPLGTSPTPNAAAGRANSSVPDPGFILAGATAGATDSERGAADQPAPASTGTAGGGGSQPGRQAQMTYVLVGRDAELSSHVGHRVTVSGVVAPPVEPKAPTSAPDPVPAPTAAADPVGKAFQSGVRQLRVTTMRMVAERCEGR